jgi:membrane peptidoglycan carboxypeptidase
VLDPLFATRMVEMLKTVITAGTGTGANIGRPAAGKTGTSQDWRDAWFVGFTPDILTAVWVGNDGGRPMAKVTGGELPAEIWRRFMTVAEKNLPARDFPWLVAEPNLPPQTLTVADQTPYEDEPAMVGAEDARAAEDAAAGGRDGADEAPPPDDGYARSDRGDGDVRPYARQDDPSDRSNPYVRDPYARDPYGDGGDAQDRAPPPPRRSWREAPAPDEYDDQSPPPPREEDRRPYSGNDDASRDGY